MRKDFLSHHLPSGWISEVWPEAGTQRLASPRPLPGPHASPCPGGPGPWELRKRRWTGKTWERSRSHPWESVQGARGIFVRGPRKQFLLAGETPTVFLLKIEVSSIVGFFFFFKGEQSVLAFLNPGAGQGRGDRVPYIFHNQTQIV